MYLWNSVGDHKTQTTRPGESAGKVKLPITVFTPI